MRFLQFHAALTVVNYWNCRSLVYIVLLALHFQNLLNHYFHFCVRFNSVKVLTNFQTNLNFNFVIIFRSNNIKFVFTNRRIVLIHIFPFIIVFFFQSYQRGVPCRDVFSSPFSSSFASLLSERACWITSLPNHF